jgi:hypothetical protein
MISGVGATAGAPISAHARGSCLVHSVGGRGGWGSTEFASGAPLYISTWSVLPVPESPVAVDSWDLGNIGNPALTWWAARVSIPAPWD